VAKSKPSATSPASKVELPAAPVAAEVPAPACWNCRHWLAVRDACHPGVGHCRRYPPSVLTPDLTLHGPKTTFPVTHQSASCGEHAPA